MNGLDFDKSYNYPNWSERSSVPTNCTNAEKGTEPDNLEKTLSSVSEVTQPLKASQEKSTSALKLKGNTRTVGWVALGTLALLTLGGLTTKALWLNQARDLPKNTTNPHVQSEVCRISDNLTDTTEGVCVARNFSNMRSDKLIELNGKGHPPRFCTANKANSAGTSAWFANPICTGPICPSTFLSNKSIQVLNDDASSGASLCPNTSESWTLDISFGPKLPINWSDRFQKNHSQQGAGMSGNQWNVGFSGENQEIVADKNQTQSQFNNSPFNITSPIKFSLSVPEVVYGILSCGSKHDSLVHVQNALQVKNALVPLFFGFPDIQIKSLLKPQSLELWRQLGEITGQASFDIRKRSNLIMLESLLTNLQTSVENDIMMGRLSLSSLQKETLAALEGKKLIVRSSSNEDTKAAVNAGGNLSLGGVDATIEGLQKAIAQVVASYFNFFSIKNRMAFEDPFKKLPLCSVLVMEQITENSKTSPIVSGVMMTSKPSWIPKEEGSSLHIAASWGFGGGVVSGEIPCDEWIVTKDQSYATIRQKTHRLVISPHGEIQAVANMPKLRESPVISETQLQQLQSVAHQLEEYFKGPMDVEFVIQGKKIYVVQARSIQASEPHTPTYLDPAAIPKNVPRFASKTIIPATSEVLSLKGQKILFAKDLEEADKAYLPALHQAVVLFREPESANTHAEVNFSSQRPPIPCFVLPEEEWKTFREILKDSDVPTKLCSQTGLLVITPIDLPVREGFFLHPAHFLLTVANAGRGLQESSQHPRITLITQLLTATAEVLSTRLEEIQGNLQSLFIEILGRQSCTGSLKEISEKLQDYATRIFGAMQEAARDGRHRSLSFHATALRKIVGQTALQVVGAHSISGLEAATYLAPSVEAFIEKHRNQNVLCELALLGRKAFELEIQIQWCAFLDKQIDGSEEQLATLLLKLKELASIDQIGLWFSTYFKADTPKMETLLAQFDKDKGFSSTSNTFINQFRHLSETTAHISTPRELASNWGALQRESEAFLQFCSAHPEKTGFQALQISHLFYELIQTWDLNIKLVRTSKILQESAGAEELKNRINQFAEFGKQAVERTGIFGTTLHKEELLQVLSEVHRIENYPSKSQRSFSVQHWLVPRGPIHTPISNEDQRLTVIHQNLLKASGPEFSDIEPFLPSTLASAVRIFKKTNPDITKRFSGDNGVFATLSDEWASVVINVPLNFHSFVLTMRQLRRSTALEITADWRGSDNYQDMHLEFLRTFADFTGIYLKNFFSQDQDLKVTFEVDGEREITLVSRAIFRANLASLIYKDDLKSLTILLHPNPKGLEKVWEDEEGMAETETMILDHLWKQFENGENNSIFTWVFSYGGKESHLQKRGLIPKITQRVVDELEGRSSGDRYKRVFLQHVFKTMSLERQKELLWNNLMGPQLSIHSELNNELLKSLKQNVPEKFKEYCLKNRYDDGCKDSTDS